MIRTNDPFGVGHFSPADQAKLAEEAGFDALWIGDHLSFRSGWIETSVAAAAAAAVTTRAVIAHGVMLTAMRPAARVAQHALSMRFIAPERFVLGIGVGGENPAEWEAVGVSVKERGKRTDDLLENLQKMMSGEPVHLPTEGVDVPSLFHKPSPVPPIAIGGRSAPAFRRSAQYADIWLGAFVNERRIREAMDAIGELCEKYGRENGPAGGMTVVTAVAKTNAEAEEQARLFVKGNYDAPWEKMRGYVAFGEPQEVAERLMSLREAGADHLVLQGTKPNPMEEFEDLAKVKGLVEEMG